MSKREELENLRQQVNLIIHNRDNYPRNELNVLVSNHNYLMDIFYLPASLPEEIISLISARLIYKNEEARKRMIERYLHAMPIEAHGGSKYTNMCLSYAEYFLKHGKSISIFPEGAYVYDNNIFKGHTGASRILFNARNENKQVNLVPVSILAPKTGDLDDYNRIGETIEISILPPIDYEEAYYNFRHTMSEEEKNTFLHEPVDKAMRSIAANIGIPYIDKYIELRPKGNVIFSDGTTVETSLAQNEEFTTRYDEELRARALKISRSIK